MLLHQAGPFLGLLAVLTVAAPTPTQPGQYQFSTFSGLTDGL